VTHDPDELGQPRPFGAIDLLDEALIATGTAADVVIGIGHAPLRRRMAAALQGNAHLRFPNLIHPRVELDPGLVSIGVGNMITQGVVMTCDITLGDFNLLNWNVTIGHDCRLGSYNVINPGSSVSGNVTMGDACLIGTGSRILENLSLCSDLIVGAGAVVTKSISAAGSYIGVPARKLGS
jgi:sugar O-acyltransferase (sialic acid O-acetyltransferase NeuD family)